MYITYKTTNLITGQYYIGSHKTDFLDDDYLGSGRILRKSIEKYGKENHKREIIGVFETREESIELEHKLVQEKKRTDKKNLLNANNGGYSFDYVNKSGKNVYIRTEQEKERLRKSSIVANEKLKLLMQDEEFARKCNEHRRIGRMNAPKHDSPMKGKHHSQEAKDKISKANKESHIGSRNFMFGKFWITNGTENKVWCENYGEIPLGFFRGRKV